MYIQNNVWLTYLDEQAIKAIFKKNILNTLHKNSKLYKSLEILNNINGLVILYLVPHNKKNNLESYIVMSCSDEMIYFLQEAIWSTSEKNPTMKIIWNEKILYKLFGIYKSLNTIVLKNKNSHKFINTLANFLET